MSQKAPGATKVKKLEQELATVRADLSLTIQAQADEIVNQLNTIIALRKEIATFRALQDGAPDKDDA